MKYTEEFFIRRSKETGKLINFLQECKYSGSWDTKVDLGSVITVISQSNLIIGELRKEIKKLGEQIKTLEEKIKE